MNLNKKCESSDCQALYNEILTLSNQNVLALAKEILECPNFLVSIDYSDIIYNIRESDYVCGTKAECVPDNLIYDAGNIIHEILNDKEYRVENMLVFVCQHQYSQLNIKHLNFLEELPECINLTWGIGSVDMNDDKVEVIIIAGCAKI